MRFRDVILPIRTRGFYHLFCPIRTFCYLAITSYINVCACNFKAYNTESGSSTYKVKMYSKGEVFFFIEAWALWRIGYAQKYVIDPVLMKISHFWQ